MHAWIQYLPPWRSIGAPFIISGSTYHTCITFWLAIHELTSATVIQDMRGQELLVRLGETTSSSANAYRDKHVLWRNSTLEPIFVVLPPNASKRDILRAYMDAWVEAQNPLRVMPLLLLDKRMTVFTLVLRISCLCNAYHDMHMANASDVQSMSSFMFKIRLLMGLEICRICMWSLRQ